MNINQLDAVNAYNQATRQLQNGAGAAGASSNVSGAGSAFSDLINQSIGDTKQATQSLEVTSAQALVGQSDLVDVVTAVSNAEMVVETVVTVRDKVIGAYNDILKMPI